VLVGAPKPQPDVTNLAVCPTIIRKGRAMLSGTDEPEFRQRQRLIPACDFGLKAGVDGRVAIQSSADDAPDRQATKALAHATIQPAVNGASTTERDLAHSIAVN
jgi:hypothetical protein